MILNIRNKDNDTIVDVELYETSEETKNGKYEYIELHSTICVKPYSSLLVRFYTDLIQSEEPPEEMANRLLEFVNDFDDMANLKRWLWEVYFTDTKKNTADEFNNVLNELRNMMKDVANKYELAYIED